MTIALSPPAELVGRVLRGGVVALPGHDDCPVRPPYDQGLVTGGMTRCRHEEDAR